MSEDGQKMVIQSDNTSAIHRVEVRFYSEIGAPLKLLWQIKLHSDMKCIEVRIGEYFSDDFPSQNSLKSRFFIVAAFELVRQ
jgi:hypothetical protein